VETHNVRRFSSRRRALGVTAFAFAATLGGSCLVLLFLIAVSAGAFACVLALPAHSLHHAQQVD
jgi:hypothetical protein